jgi:hypothetical protein
MTAGEKAMNSTSYHVTMSSGGAFTVAGDQYGTIVQGMKLQQPLIELDVDGARCVVNPSQIVTVVPIEAPIAEAPAAA